jgi:hypothetical protein
MKALLWQAMAILGVLSFWGGILIAAQKFPAEYDWRYMTLSSLISPSRDPAGHLWASGGIVLCALCGLGWAASPGRGLAAAHEALDGSWLLRLGNLFMIGSAVLPSSLLRMPKGHEILVLLAFVCLCLGMVILTFRTVEGSLQRRDCSCPPFPKLYAAGLAVGAVLPILLAGLAQAYVFYALPHLRWVSLAWRDRRIPVYLSFAFWEWVSCVVLSAYMITLPLLIPHLERRVPEEK